MKNGLEVGREAPDFETIFHVSSSAKSRRVARIGLEVGPSAPQASLYSERETPLLADGALRAPSASTVYLTDHALCPLRGHSA